ncbi:MAG: hypothetical protein ABW146_17430 [Candidatus Sedimenticola sp. 6PFRAG7]
MNEEFEVKMSPLCQEISSGGKAVQVDIYEHENGGWILEVVDEFNNSTVWDDPFETDNAALAEVKKTILSEGIDSLIGLKE